MYKYLSAIKGRSAATTHGGAGTRRGMPFRAPISILGHLFYFFFSLLTKLSLLLYSDSNNHATIQRGFTSPQFETSSCKDETLDINSRFLWE